MGVRTYLLSNHGGGVEGAEGEVHVSGEHGGLVLVLGLESACKSHSVESQEDKQKYDSRSN